jgi:UPF0176 protein
MSTAALPITNISCYKFAPLSDLKARREALVAQCKAADLRGTILLSTEGINFFVAGPRHTVDALVDELRTWPGLAEIAPKYSSSADQPFRRMLVRIKKEIIAFGVEGIDPARNPAPKLSPRELKQWLDEGRPITLLDTRNDYEVELGTFRGAVIPHIDHFRSFPEAVAKLPPELKEQPIVMFCTGGIRCEKAGPFMQREGFREVYQLDGGILKYFEECGGAHYDGECFVFDQRVGLDPHLEESDTTVCFRCQSPIRPADQDSPRYLVGKYCPACYKDSAQLMSESLARRRQRFAQISHPLPGSIPYNNFRPMSVTNVHDGLTLAQFLTNAFPHLPTEKWDALFAANQIQDAARQPVKPDQTVRAGERYFQFLPQMLEPPVRAEVTFLHEDSVLVVVTKSAPLPMHPGGRFNRNTLLYMLNEVYWPDKLRPVHRLDANTTGLLVLARTRQLASLLQPQFQRGEVEKLYHARVQGHPTQDAFISTQPISDEPDECGRRNPDAQGQPARTEFQVLSRDPDGTALLQCRPITGRTNQIRIHLWMLGHPIIGDGTYLPNGKTGNQQTLSVDAPPMLLHAHTLSFLHPLTNQRLHFSVERAL